MKRILWSVRRELWEHRWLWSVPLIVATIVFTVFAGVAIRHLPSTSAGMAEASKTLAAGLSGIFDLASRMVLMTGTIVSFVYCAESLHGERRDRAILFWRSWPISDGTSVGAKAVTAMVVVPAVTLVLLIAAQAVAKGVLAGSAIQLHAPMVGPVAATLEVLAATLWTAPVYAWIMVVSAWARRAVLVLALLPTLLVIIVEAMFGGEHIVGRALVSRGVGRHWPVKLDLVATSAGEMVSQPAPELLRSPALWAGVALAVLLLALATRVRRRMRLL